MPLVACLKFKEAIREFDRLNAEDPRVEINDGTEEPRELLFARRVYDWVTRLNPNASEELLLAARGHTLRRWAIPRGQFAITRGGYHQWRKALALYHADQADAVLIKIGYSDETRRRVRDLIERKLFPNDADARTLEDADCLVFLETKLHLYFDEWGDLKTVEILRKTLPKMTAEAKNLAASLPLPKRSADLLAQAVESSK